MEPLHGATIQGNTDVATACCRLSRRSSFRQLSLVACGMTLVEILVVLGIVGLILGISVPGLTNYANKTRLKAVTRQVVGLVGLARSVAISAHADHALHVDTEQKELTIENLASGELLERVVRLPPSVTVELEEGGSPAPQSRIIFRPTGSLSGRTVSIILADRQGRNTVTVSSITGAVTVD